MALDATDWTIDRSTKKIAYVGDDHGGASPTYVTVIEFHRWLQSLADDAVASGDDELDITNTDPSRRSTDNIITLINGYSLDETVGTPASEHLYDGSIIQDDGQTIFDGIVNFGNADVVIQIIQDGGVIADDWWNLASGAGANADANAGISHRFMIMTREYDADIDGRRLLGTTRVLNDTDQKTFGEFKINGTSRGNNVLALTNSDDLNNEQTATVIGGWANITNTEGLNLIDVNDDGTDEEYYSKWADSAGGFNQNDFYEWAKYITRDGSGETVHGMNGELFRGISHYFGFSGTGWDPVTNDVGVWGTYVSVVAATGFTVGEAVADNSDLDLATWNGRVLAIDATDNSLILYLESGVTIGNGDTVYGFTSTTSTTTDADPTEVVGGGRFTCLAVDDDGGTGNIYMQVANGTAPPNSATIYESTDLTNTLTLTSASTSAAISIPFIGVSTGSNIIGAFGIGFNTSDIDNNDTLTALDDSQYSRPNLVTNTVSGLNISDGDFDRVIVAPWDGTTRDVNNDPEITKDQLSVASAVPGLTSADVTTITMAEDIPADTPSFGTIRVTDDDGFERWLPYDSWDTKTFTLDTDNSTGLGAIGDNNDFDTVNVGVGNDAYITYIDRNASGASHNYQATYDAVRNLVVLVRNGDNTKPIKQFISEWSFTASNATLNVIRTTDT